MPLDSSATSPYLQNYQQPQYVSRINNYLTMSPESTTTSWCLQSQQPHHVTRIINNLIMSPESPTTPSSLQSWQPHHVSRINNLIMSPESKTTTSSKLKRNCTLTKKGVKMSIIFYMVSSPLSLSLRQWVTVTDNPGYSPSETRESSKSEDSEADRFRRSAIHTCHNSALSPEINVYGGKIDCILYWGMECDDHVDIYT